MADEGVSLQSGKLQDQRRQSSLYIEENDDVIGLEVDVKTLVARLTEGESRRCVISIVGMGGSGKTTLAKKVYNNYDVKRHFDSCHWVVVSQEHSVKEFFQHLGEKIMGIPKEESKKMKIEALEEKLVEFLKQKKYLIVLDDLGQSQAWDDLEAGFPDAKNGSRVLVTTHSRDVAVRVDLESPPFELRHLDEKESWQLFLRNTFRSFRDTATPCPPELEDLGKLIVSKAGGLPLAILALGGIVQNSVQNPQAWVDVLENTNWELSQILALGYLYLPSSLKPCFLYFSVFPEDFEIHAETLIQVWVAEGFIEHQNQAKSMEDIAEDYLEELVDRNMVQVVKRNPIGNVEKCRVHNLLRELAISEAKKDDFSCILEKGFEAPTNVRRLAIYNDTIIYSDLKNSNPHLQAVWWLAPNSSATLSGIETESICGSFKLLKVLILCGPNVSKLPYEIGELIHLTYLEWWADFPKDDGIPSSIGNLHQLQTLCLSSSKEFYVPNEVWNLPQLRFVWFGRPGHALIKGRPNKVSSTNLQTLSRVETGPWMEDCLGKFMSLRRLEMWGDFMMFGDVLNDAIVNMESLRILKLVGHKDRIKALVTLSQHRYIFKMHLEGRLEKLPDAHEFPPNLTQLILIGSEFEQDPLPTLEKLPNLTFLELMGKSYVGEKLVCSASGFPRLQELTVSGLPKLKEWKVEEGAMPNLKRLVIAGCDQLEELPEGLQHVTGLRELELIAMPVESRNRVVENGEDWYKIQHIPSLSF